jgi:hypothetical protein
MRLVRSPFGPLSGNRPLEQDAKKWEPVFRVNPALASNSALRLLAAILWAIPSEHELCERYGASRIRRTVIPDKPR